MSNTKQTQADRERNLRMRTANNLLVTLLGWGDGETYWTSESQREWLAQERQMNAAREAQLERSIKTAAQPNTTARSCSRTGGWPSGMKARQRKGSSPSAPRRNDRPTRGVRDISSARHAGALALRRVIEGGRAWRPGALANRAEE